MQDIEIFTENGKVFSLKLARAVSDENAHVRADVFLFLYQFYLDNKLLLPYFFIDQFSFFPEQKTVFLQEYPTEFAGGGSQSSSLSLRLADLDRQETAKISQLSGGRFAVKEWTGNRLIYQKILPGYSQEFEMNTDQIRREKFSDR